MKLQKFIKKLTNLAKPAGYLLGFSLLLSLVSCGWVREDLEPCDVDRDPETELRVVELRFVYDYNMERANAFHNQVDCLSVYFFNEDGELIDHQIISEQEILADEDFRLYPELPAGKYRVVAYGGMDCENASFYRVGNFPMGSHYKNLHVQLDPLCLSMPEKHRLHNHYYGALDFTINADGDTKETVKMMRNTNSIQVALQNEDTGQSIDHNDFIFEITDDNNDFGHDNALIPSGEITYKPWLVENRQASSLPEYDKPGQQPSTTTFHAAVAQFTTSRLMIADGKNKHTSTRLKVSRADGSEVVFSVPLVSYMLMFKHDNTGAGLDDMGDQEYLDRENTWNFVFFIKNGMWYDAHIIINNWEVRKNGTTLE